MCLSQRGEREVSRSAIFILLHLTAHKLITKFCDTPRNTFFADPIKKKKKVYFDSFTLTATVVWAVVIVLIDHQRERKSVSLTGEAGTAVLNIRAAPWPKALLLARMSREDLPLLHTGLIAFLSFLNFLQMPGVTFEI